MKYDAGNERGGMVDLDFTIKKYQELCEIMQEHYTTSTIYEYISKYQPKNLILSEESTEPIAVLRHDVDRKIANAVRMAELEHDLDIQSSYYFRYPYTYEPDVINYIHNLGHEIGYHYETLTKANGDINEATILFEEELEAFRKICEVTTICMHGNVLSPYDNRDLIRKIKLDAYGLIGEASISIERITYFTDTGRRWDSNSNIRDTVHNSIEHKDISSTDDLISCLIRHTYQHVYINAHPERWSAHPSEWIKNLMKPKIFNTGKMIILYSKSFH